MEVKQGLACCFNRQPHTSDRVPDRSASLIRSDPALSSSNIVTTLFVNMRFAISLVRRFMFVIRLDLGACGIPDSSCIRTGIFVAAHTRTLMPSAFCVH